MDTKCFSPHLVFLSTFILSSAFSLTTLPLVEAQPSSADAVRLLEQSTFGPTYALIAHVQQVSIEGFLNEQSRAPMTDYPELPFWPQTRPTTCTNVTPSTCQRDNYTMYPLQQHFFLNALSGQDQLRQRVAFVLGQILVTSAVDIPYAS